MAGNSREHQPPAAIWHAEQGKSQNISTSFMKPLYTSCREQHGAHAKNHNPFYRPSNTGGVGSASTTSSSTTADSAPRQQGPRFLALDSLPRMPSALPTTQQRDPMGSPLLRLPTELRLQIYSLLVFPRRSTDLLCSWDRLQVSAVDAVDYSRWLTDGDGITGPSLLQNPILRIRTIDPTCYKGRYPAERPHTRTCYSVRADRFANRCMATTYHCVNVPRIKDNLAIMRTNKHVHAEVAELMYSYYTFDFDTHIEAIIPFLRDLTPSTRSCIKSMRFTKKALAYTKEFDRCEWENALRYITNADNNINLRRLELGVIAGRPGENGWDGVATYSAADFNLLKTQEGMEWLQYVEEINKVQELEVQAIVEHCPSITSSNAMASYVRFSASVEHGFTEYLKGRLVAPEVLKRLAGCSA